MIAAWRQSSDPNRSRVVGYTDYPPGLIVAISLTERHALVKHGYERAEGVRLLFIGARSDLDNHIQQHGAWRRTKARPSQ